MPDEVEHICGKAQKHKGQKPDVCRLFPQGDSGIRHIQGDQQKNGHAAVDVGPVIQTRFHIHVHAVPCDHIKEGKIEGQRVRKIKFTEVCQVKRRIFRNEKHGRQSSRKEREEGKPDSRGAHLSQGHVRADELQQEIQHQENADHDGNIVVGENAQRQADAVELIFSLLYQSLQAHRDQRKQDDAVQPHHIPVVGRQEAGKCIKNGEGNQHEALRFKMAGQIKAEGKAAQTDFQSHQPGHEFDQVLIGHQNHQPVDGARHIITVQREKIGAYPHIPGIEKAVPAFQLALHFGEKGDILVIHVGMHEALIPERIYAVDDENAAHDGEGDKKGKQAGRVLTRGRGQLSERETLRKGCCHGCYPPVLPPQAAFKS